MKNHSHSNRLSGAFLSLIVVLTFAVLHTEHVEAQGRTKITLKTSKRKVSGNRTIKNQANSARDSLRKKDRLDTLIIQNGDTIEASDAVLFSGYDKPLQATKESLLVTNQLPIGIKKIKLKITYRDMKGRMLHARELTLTANVPASETRKIDFSSWDSQHSYFYFRSQEPRRTATPYKVDVALQGVAVAD